MDQFKKSVAPAEGGEHFSKVMRHVVCDKKCDKSCDNFYFVTPILTPKSCRYPKCSNIFGFRSRRFEFDSRWEYHSIGWDRIGVVFKMISPQKIF